MRQNKHLVNLALIAILSAVSTVIMLMEFPLLPASPHLKMDFSDLPAIAAACLINPLAGVAVELVKNLMQLLIKGAGSTMGFGNIMNFLTGCAVLLPFIFVYRIDRKRENTRPLIIVLASAAGVLGIVLIGVIGNYFITPPFFKYVLEIELSSEALWAQIVTATAFNIIKGTILVILSIPLLSLVTKRFAPLINNEYY